MFQDVINPARFSEVVGHVRMCSQADVEKTIELAQTAFTTWSRTAPEHRASILSEAARHLRNSLHELVPLFVRENGKPLREAEIDIRRSIELMKLIASDLPEWWRPTILDPLQ